MQDTNSIRYSIGLDCIIAAGILRLTNCLHVVPCCVIILDPMIDIIEQQINPDIP